MSLGQAVVDIIGNTGPLDRSVSGLDGSLRKAILGSAVGNVIADGVGAIARGVVNVGKKILDITVGGGFDRALNIQDARASLTGLGHDAATVDTIMSNALDSVRGTAFGLDDAAKVAASAVAAGIEPGERLTGVLKTVADTATIAGAPLGDIGAIFNKVAAGGKVTTEVLNQLGDRGVPALQFLSQELGVSTEAVREMVTRGEVDFATFEAAMRGGLGGAALESGNTFRGAMANVQAAVSRIGAMFAGPIVAGAPQIFQAIAGAIDQVGAVLAPVAERFGEWLAPAMAEVANWIGELDFAALFDDIGSGTGPLSSILALFNPLGSVIRALLPTLISLGGTLADAGQTIGRALVPILPVLADALVSIVTAAAPLVDMLAGALAQILPVVATMLAQVVQAAAPLIPVVVQLVTQALNLLVPIIADLAQTLFPVLAQILGVVVQAIAPLIPVVLQVIEAFLPLLSVIGDLIGALLPPLMEIVMALLPVFVQVVDILVALLIPAFEAVGAIVTWLVKNILVPFYTWFAETLGQAISAFADWFSAKWTEISEFWSSVWNTIKAVAEVIWNSIKSAVTNAVNNVRNTVTNVMNAVSGAWSAVWNTIKNTVTNAVSDIRSAWDNVMSFFSGLPARVRSVFSNVGSAISNAFKSAFNRVAWFWNSTVGRLGFTIPGWVPGIGGNSWSMPKIPMMAKGGFLKAAGLALVGENGPELLNLPKGASVVPLNREDGGIEDILRKIMAVSTPAPAAIGGFERAQTQAPVSIRVDNITISLTGTDPETARKAGEQAADALLDRLALAVQVR